MDAPPPALSTTPDWTLSGVGASGLAAASTVLLLLYITARFLWVYNKHAAATEAPGFTVTAALSVPPVAPLRSREVILTMLPVLVSAGPAPECAVCLSALSEAGRVMPACAHAFHEECIVAWLRIHATCPLCRTAVAAKEVGR